MAFLGVLLAVIGLVFMIKNAVNKWKLARNERKREKSVGEIMGNKYVLAHEKKISDDKVYEEYLDWCHFHGELPLEKSEFEIYRHKEWQMSRKIKKAIQ